MGGAFLAVSHPPTEDLNTPSEGIPYSMKNTKHIKQNYKPHMI